MAQELSQAELLDFLCRAGGRVANAALLGHFKRFLRDPRADPGQLQRRRHLFKGFVNSVATVSQDGPGAATYVVLKKRYRDLIGEEESEPPRAPAGRSPPPQLQQAPKSPGAAAASLRETREAGRFSDGEVAAGRRKAGRCPPAAPGVGSWPSPPASPAMGCLGGERKGPRQPLAEPNAPDPPPSSNGLGLPIGEMGPLPNGGSAQQRIRDWVVTHHAASMPSQLSLAAEEAFPVPAWSQSSDRSSCRPCGSLDFGSSEGWRDPPVPVFRSIRSRLSLQDMEDHLEQESSVSEEGSSASRESGSHPRDGEADGSGIQNSAGHEGPGDAPHSNGLVMPLVQDAKPPPHMALLHRIVGRATTMGKAEGRDLLRKTGRPPSPNLDAPLSPRLAPRQSKCPIGRKPQVGTKTKANAPLAERLAPKPDGSAEHRSSSVPLDGREHTWLVKIATGSWMQVRVLLQEDPHLVLNRDFVSGFTVLHWLAKHGNAQALQDFVTGAQEAGIVLDVNVRSGCGYTPLHLAAIHSHPMVMKILVERLQCQTQVRDSSGKRAWQYLSANASGEIWQLLGAPRGRTIFPTHPIVRPAAVSSPSTSLARRVSRKPSLASYLKPQHMKRKKGCKCSILQEIEEYSD